MLGEKKGLGKVKGHISGSGIKGLTNKQFLGAHRETSRFSGEPAHPFGVYEVSEDSYHTFVMKEGREDSVRGMVHSWCTQRYRKHNLK